jgi:hypothetical protein
MIPIIKTMRAFQGSPIAGGFIFKCNKYVAGKRGELISPSLTAVCTYILTYIVHTHRERSGYKAPRRMQET